MKNSSSISNLVLDQLSTLQSIELISAVLTVWGVWLNARPSIWGWPIGIVSVLLASVVYFESRLFAEFGLQLFYAVSGLYGWWNWFVKKEQEHELRILKINRVEAMTGLFIGMMVTIVLAGLLKRYTSADLPVFDSALAAFSLVAQVWMARKFMENWLLWMVINLVSIGVYIYKELWFFTLLFAILFVLAIIGFTRWNRKWKSQINLG